MNYKSTRNSSLSVPASEAIRKGISDEGGLFVPEKMPWLSYNDLTELTKVDYVTRAADILGRFLGDFTPSEVLSCVSRAYTRGKFETDSIAPIYKLEDNLYLLELWHGPTSAFKDMALQLLPHLMSTSVAKGQGAEDATTVILVATSGDTGKAALEGFRDVPGMKIMVFYPQDGVSPMQLRQMQTQEGENVFVCAIKGNFDDAQSGVKAIFTDERIKEKLKAHKLYFSSANSINWGRLVPQIVYYISSYCDMVKNNKITMGERINIVVPTGNFGNILAAYYANKMGIPVNRLICASNSNNVLTDFIISGVYDRNRSFYTTISPSMDILISSNLERMLYDLSGCDDRKVVDWMLELAAKGKYEVDDSVKNAIHEHFWAGFCDDEQTRQTIHEVYEKFSYVCDPHTAVALNVYEQYKQKTGDMTKTIVASTASPFKFAGDVLQAIGGDVAADETDEALIDRLAKLSMTPAPRQITSLFSKPSRFTLSCDKTAMKEIIFEQLAIEE